MLRTPYSVLSFLFTVSCGFPPSKLGLVLPPAKLVVLLVLSFFHSFFFEPFLFFSILLTEYLVGLPVVLQSHLYQAQGVIHVVVPPVGHYYYARYYARYSRPRRSNFPNTIRSGYFDSRILGLATILRTVQRALAPLTHCPTAIAGGFQSPHRKTS